MVQIYYSRDNQGQNLGVHIGIRTIGGTSILHLEYYIPDFAILNISLHSTIMVLIMWSILNGNVYHYGHLMECDIFSQKKFAAN